MDLKLSTPQQLPVTSLILPLSLLLSPEMLRHRRDTIPQRLRHEALSSSPILALYFKMQAIISLINHIISSTLKVAPQRLALITTICGVSPAPQPCPTSCPHQVGLSTVVALLTRHSRVSRVHGLEM